MTVADPSVEIFREDRRVRYVERVSQRSGVDGQRYSSGAPSLGLAGGSPRRRPSTSQSLDFFATRPSPKFIRDNQNPPSARPERISPSGLPGC
jgi:hypothetical protein